MFGSPFLQCKQQHTTMKHEQDIIERLDRIEKTIHGIKERPLTFAEAADYLGISKSYLYKLTSQARIRTTSPKGKRSISRKRN